MYLCIYMAVTVIWHCRVWLTGFLLLWSHFLEHSTNPGAQFSKLHKIFPKFVVRFL